MVVMEAPARQLDASNNLFTQTSATYAGVQLYLIDARKLSSLIMIKEYVLPEILQKDKQISFNYWYNRMYLNVHHK